MLEKSRLVRRPEGEPTFHVFYQMLAGLDSNLRYANNFSLIVLFGRVVILRFKSIPNL